MKVMQRFLDVVWFGGIAGAILLLLVLAGLMIVAPEVSDGNPGMMLQAPGLDLEFTRVAADNLPPGFGIWQFALLLPLIAAGLVVIHQLRGLTGDISAQKPFAVQNQRRLRMIGFAVITGSLLYDMISFIVGVVIANAVEIPGLAIEAAFGVNLAGVFAGCVILVLAAAFRHGAVLQEEQDLTV